MWEWEGRWTSSALCASSLQPRNSFSAQGGSGTLRNHSELGVGETLEELDPAPTRIRAVSDLQTP